MSDVFINLTIVTPDTHNSIKRVIDTIDHTVKVYGHSFSNEDLSALRQAKSLLEDCLKKCRDKQSEDKKREVIISVAHALAQISRVFRVFIDF